MSRPRTSSAVAVAAALVLAGCGGGDDGDPRTFARQADHVCAGLATAVGDLRDGLVRTDAASEGAGLSSALTRYATSTRRFADELARTRPPRNERAFRDDAVSGLRRHARAMRRAAEQVRDGREASALRDELRGGALPAVPATLLADAPACRRATSNSNSP
ncbi:MAG: hypothetical protein Q7T67_03140, partial [Patulibacter sp.]